jgi:hypothetical protein
MTLLYILLLVAGAVCFLLATFNAPVKLNLVALGLLLWILVPLITAVRAY